MKSQANAIAWTLSLIGTLASPASGQDLSAENVPMIDRLTPLVQYLQKPEEERIPAYPFLRCSGLFLGYNYYAGANLDIETRSRTENTIVDLRAMGVLVTLMQNASRREIAIDDIDEVEVDKISEDLWRKINAFAFFYDNRMKENFLNDGAAFSEDELISGDLGVCQSVAQVAAQAGE